MLAKYEWRKKEKKIYIPKNKPEVIEIPEYKFITISAKGSPADKLFTDCITALYSVSYALKMAPKRMEKKPKGYFDYTVYPLEGVWDINDEAKKTFTGIINKEDLVYTLMIRQPEFVEQDFFNDMLALVGEKKPQVLLEKLKFERITEGQCIQMLHVGKYEDEPISFAQMEAFAENSGFTRTSKVHREIYLSDVRKVAPEKLKTVLRFTVL
ncbi:MAG: GyrI-like domain-containing protein [Colwellia sp.]